LNSINEKVIEQNNLIFSLGEENNNVLIENKKLRNSWDKSKEFIERLFTELEKSEEKRTQSKKKR